MRYNYIEMSESKPKRQFSSKFMVIATLCALTIGVVVGQSSGSIVAAVASRLGINIPGLTYSIDFSDAQNVYSLLKSRYNGEITDEKLYEYINKGVAASAEDPYTEYFTVEEAEELERDLEGSIGGGIGAEIGMRGDKPTIVRPLKNTPAERAGLKAGDIIISVNGDSVAGLTADEVVQLIRGDIGTSVKLVLQRNGSQLETSVKREEIVTPDVESQVKDGVGIIKLNRFGADSATKLRAAAEDMKRQNVRGVVLDLRGNGGGYLQTGVDVASVWLNDKVVVSEKGKVNGDKSINSNKSPILEGVPTVVLIDQGSASASEIVAGALKDNNAATLIGEKSYGKGSVQEMIDLPRGDLLKVTVANWFTPAGKNISKEGIEPDQKVEITADDINNNRDPQLDAAVTKLQNE